MTAPKENFQSGFVAVMGRPNVGKSTLINALLGQKIAAVSPRPQTTRHQQLGILTTKNTQVIFVDTPGLHNPQHKLGQHMNQEATFVLDGVDVILFVVEANQLHPNEEDRILVELLGQIDAPPPVIIALNKIDQVETEQLAEVETAYQDLLPNATLIKISAINHEHLDELLAAMMALLPEGAPFYPEDQITDIGEREIAADLIRAAALIILRDEVPHAIAVRVDEFTERSTTGAYIAATLFVERESQKGIVIGNNGSMLKRIGSAARKEIEAMTGRKVFLKLRVKVRKNWRNDENALKKFGFQRTK